LTAPPCEKNFGRVNSIARTDFLPHAGVLALRSSSTTSRAEKIFATQETLVSSMLIASREIARENARRVQRVAECLL
jgi:hypothetical protein